MRDTRRADPGAEDRREAPAKHEDAAVFAVERVVRGRPPLLAIGLAVAIAGASVAGVLNSAAQPASTASPLEAAVVGTDETRPAERPQSRRWVEGPYAPISTPEPRAPGRGPRASLLRLQAEVDENIVLVHADVYTRSASVVVVSIVEGRNRFVQLRTVDMPGGSTAFRLGGNDSFDLVFDLPTVLHSKDAWVSANAYDLTGNIIARARTALAGGAVGAARAGS